MNCWFIQWRNADFGDSKFILYPGDSATAQKMLVQIRGGGGGDGGYLEEMKEDMKKQGMEGHQKDPILFCYAYQS